jgi:CRP-like cAMP-binding protein
MDNTINPKDAGDSRYGVINGIMGAPSFIAEDAFVLNQRISYTLRAKTNVIALRYSCKLAKH